MQGSPTGMAGPLPISPSGLERSEPRTVCRSCGRPRTSEWRSETLHVDPCDCVTEDFVIRIMGLAEYAGVRTFGPRPLLPGEPFRLLQGNAERSDTPRSPVKLRVVKRDE